MMRAGPSRDPRRHRNRPCLHLLNSLLPSTDRKSGNASSSRSSRAWHVPGAGRRAPARFALQGDEASYGLLAANPCSRGYKMHFSATADVPRLVLGRGTRCTFQLRSMYPLPGTGCQLQVFTILREGASAPATRRSRPVSPSQEKARFSVHGNDTTGGPVWVTPRKALHVERLWRHSERRSGRSHSIAVTH